MKSKVTLLVDKDTIEKAKKIGINLSQFLEYNLKKAIRSLEHSNNDSSQAIVDNTENSYNVKRRGWDLNPRDLSVTDLAGLRPTRLGDPGSECIITRHFLSKRTDTISALILTSRGLLSFS